MELWISTRLFTVFVETNELGVIIDTASITRRFIGQHITALLRWGKSIGELKIEIIETTIEYYEKISL